MQRVTELPLLGRRYSAQAPLPTLSESQSKVRDHIRAMDDREDWEEVPRCLCGGNQTNLVSETERHGLPYRKLLCIDCGLLYVSPRWTAARFARFYADEYRVLYGGSRARSVVEDVRWLAAQAGARNIAAFIKDVAKCHAEHAVTQVVVEIGAGGGWNLAALPKEWLRIGYDLDIAYLDAGRQEFGLDMRRGFLDQAEADIRKADIVLLSHVVEHLWQPVASLQRLAEWMRPDTCAVIEVPGIFRIHQTVRDPMAYMQNAHLYTFCADTIARLCRRSGFRVLYADEWCRVVVQRGSDPDLPPNSELARRVSRYLVRCELLLRVSRALDFVPWVGVRARRALYRLVPPLLGMRRIRSASPRDN